MDFRVFSRNISENMHARCVREDTKQALTVNLQADGVQSRQTLFVRYCLRYAENKKRLCRREIPVAEPFFCVVFNDTIIHRDMLEIGFPSMRLR